MDAMSCLAPHPASFLPNTSSQAYYTDAAIARALNSSMPDHYSPGTASTSSPSSSSSLLADLPYSDGTNVRSGASAPTCRSRPTRTSTSSPSSPPAATQAWSRSSTPPRAARPPSPSSARGGPAPPPRSPRRPSPSPSLRTHAQVFGPYVEQVVGGRG
nr:uncharacterized protein LOC127309937 [Lolium perenne]